MKPQVLTTITSASAGSCDELAAGAVEVAQHDLGVHEVLGAAEADDPDPLRLRVVGTVSGAHG